MPHRGRVLDVGCGAGLWLNYLALERPELDLEGLDPDPRKLATLRASGSDEIQVHEGSALELPTGPFDCITIFDVLYLLSDVDKDRVLAGCLERLSPNGTFLVKELDVRPRWKFIPSAIEEFLAVRLVNMTRGDRLHSSVWRTWRRDSRGSASRTSRSSEWMEVICTLMCWCGGVGAVRAHLQSTLASLLCRFIFPR